MRRSRGRASGPRSASCRPLCGSKLHLAKFSLLPSGQQLLTPAVTQDLDAETLQDPGFWAQDSKLQAFVRQHTKCARDLACRSLSESDGHPVQAIKMVLQSAFHGA